MASPSEALQHPMFNPLPPNASEEATRAHLKQARLRLQFLWAQCRLQRAASEDTKATAAEIGVFRRVLTARKDTESRNHR